MSQPESPEPQINEQQRRNRGKRLLIVGAMLVSLILTAVTGDVARSAREQATRGNNPINAGGRMTVSGLNSFTLALVLGGLRGPLVMMLWMSSETQKQEKNLEDFDTKVEMIRLLQPEFDSVHIFQVWNKAYNISVQMSSLYNKYVTILDAIEYGENVLRARPDNINMQTAVADVYFNKLGNSAEKIYFRARVRKETLPHTSRQRVKRDDPSWRRIEMDSIVDSRGFIDPKYLKPLRTRPSDLPDDQPFNDGSELQYLKPLQPFVYGVSPYAMAYNYYLQAQTIQRLTHAKHAQTSELVVDSRPAITMRFWSEEEHDLGRRHELAAFGREIPPDAGVEKLLLEMPLAELPLNTKPVDQAKFDEAAYNYARAAELTRVAISEYQRHLKAFATNAFTYQSHLDHLNGMLHLQLADAAYLQAMNSTGDARTQALATARKEYEEAVTRFLRHQLRYYTDETVARDIAQRMNIVPDFSRAKIDELQPGQLQALNLSLNQLFASGVPDQHEEDRKEYSTYIDRALARLRTMQK